MEYLLYVPSSLDPDPRIIVSVHGVSRNSGEHAKLLAPYCDMHGAILVVPHFSEEAYPDYQRLGRAGRGRRADIALNLVVAEVSLMTQAPGDRFFLFGFSGGAQFAHRYAMAHPHRIAHAAFASAGWYTWPDPATKFPYGTRATRTLPGVRFDAEEYLQIPMHVYVGTKDTTSKGLRRTERVDRMQGTSRVERAMRWVGAMKKTAEAHFLEPMIFFEELEGSGHSFPRTILRSGLGERLFGSMFSERSSEQRKVESG